MQLDCYVFAALSGLCGQSTKHDAALPNSPPPLTPLSGHLSESVYKAHAVMLMSQDSIN